MMRRTLLAFLLLGIASLPALAQLRTDKHQDGFDSHYRTMSSKLALARISLDFQDAPLTDVLSFIRNVVDINILIDPGVYKTHPKGSLKVTLKLKQVKAESALNLLLSFYKLSRQYTSGVLLITTQERVEDKVYSVIYSVRDMMFSLRDFPGPNIDLTQPSGGTGGGIKMSDSAKGANNELADKDQLIEVIKGNSARSSWENPKCSISFTKGLLIVSQTRSGHYEVNRLLRLLRSFR